MPVVFDLVSSKQLGTCNLSWAIAFILHARASFLATSAIVKVACPTNKSRSRRHKYYKPSGLQLAPLPQAILQFSLKEVAAQTKKHLGVEIAGLRVTSLNVDHHAKPRLASLGIIAYDKFS